MTKNSNFCLTSNHRAAHSELMKTKMFGAAGFPMSLKDKTSILFEDRLDNYFLQVLRIVGPFAVLIVVQDERVSFLLKSLSHVHNAVFSFLVLLQRNPVVDSLVLEHLYSKRVPNLSFFEFFSSRVATPEWSSNASSSY